MKKITITRALAEIKLLGARINSATAENFIGVGRGSKCEPLSGVKTKEALESEIKGNFQSVMDLIKRRDEFKAKVLHSNSTTQVVIAGETMTVAQAIDRKITQASIAAVLSQLRQQYLRAEQQVQAQNAIVDREQEKRLLTIYGSDKTKVTEEQTKMINAAVKDQFEGRLIDPLGTPDLIKKLQKLHDDFMLEVDFALSESNSKTEIEVTE